MSFTKTTEEDSNYNHLEKMSVLELLKNINSEDKSIPNAVEKSLPEIEKLTKSVVEKLKKGGRLFYCGAGTSGRLGVLDASECPPTFGTSHDLVRGIIAGGLEALTRSIEGAEDSQVDGERAIIENGIIASDTVVGITTGGTTPFVHAALIQASRIGATTVFLCCNPDINPTEDVDVTIRPITGPEVLSGSTRMKAGTATKLILNTLTTASMIKMGKVYENLMVDLQVKNVKLKDRAERIIMTVTGLNKCAADKLLDEAKGNVKTAIVMHKLRTDYEDARKKLDEHDGLVRKVLNSV